MLFKKSAIQIPMVIAMALLLARSASLAADGVIDIRPTGSATFEINQRGSYRLVTDVTMAGDFSCINITANDVSLDLNGHTIQNSGGDIGANGISGAAADRVTIHSGTVRGFSLSGIVLQDSATIYDVTVEANRGHGIQAQDDAMISNCRAIGNGQNGNMSGIKVETNSTIRDCVASGIAPLSVNGSAYGISVDFGCTISNNRCADNVGTGSGLGAGIFASGGGNLILNNLCRGNVGGAASGFGHGIYVGNGSGNTIRGNTCTNNNGGAPEGWGHGIRTFFGGNTIDQNTCAFNDGQGPGIGVGIYCTQANGSVTNNYCHSNDGGAASGSGTGIQVSSNTRVVGNTCSGNGGGAPNGNGRGITAGDGALIQGNHCTANNGQGTGSSVGVATSQRSRIEGNHSVGHTGPSGYGVHVTAGDNLVAGNTTSNNSTAGINLGAGGNRCELNRMSDATPIVTTGTNEIGAGDLANEPY